MILFVDTIIANEIAPLRAAWAPIGMQARVPIIAARDSRALTGVLNIRSGDCISWPSARYNQTEFQATLRLTRSHWRGWNIVLFLDRHSAQTAKRSRALARQCGIELRWLPTACPELNPVDHLWRAVVQNVTANEPTPDLDETIERMQRYLHSLSRQERRQKAGILSDGFWLADVIR